MEQGDPRKNGRRGVGPVRGADGVEELNVGGDTSAARDLRVEGGQ